MWAESVDLFSIRPAALQLDIYGLTLGTIELLALVFGLLWVLLNFYQFVPIVGLLVENHYSSFLGRREQAASSEDAPLPTIDILLPAYEEGRVIEQSIRSVRRADYPQNRLNLFVIVEPDDDDTRDVLRTLNEPRFTELVVPARYPGIPNKPRALNYGFEHTEAEIVGVVDAEDLVDPSLFREAVAEIRSGRDFVQARLDMVNEDDGWLNTQFRAEYGFWYNIVLPAFQRQGYPLPLSGTSCLFRRSLLVVANEKRRETYGEKLRRDARLWTGNRRLFGWTPWDPDNVTEDFELGLFLWEQGFDVGYLESTTAEESPLSLDEWMKQRTRWKKGKLQTLSKYLRVPPEGIGPKGHLFWQSFLPHVGPVNLVGAILLFVIANLAKYDPSFIVRGVLSVGIAFFVLSTAMFGIGYWMASDSPLLVRSRRLGTVVLTLPIYWLLQWVADIRALRQWYTGLESWERVTHYGRNSPGGSLPVVDPGSQTMLPARLRRVVLLGIVLGGATLRLVNLDGMSLWVDEIYSIAIRGQMPLPELLLAPSDPHPPLYYLLLKGWMALFGKTAMAARALSAILSIATIPALYLLGKELFDDRVGLLAAGFLAFSTYHIHFGRTARMYGLFGLLAVLSWLAFNRLRSGSLAATAGYVLASAALVYTHAFGLVVILAQYVFMSLSETRGRIPGDRWLKLQTGFVVIIAPVLTMFSWRLVSPILGRSASTPIEWIPIPSTVAVTQTLLAYVGHPAHYPILPDSAVLWVLASGLLLGVLGLVVLSVITFSAERGYTLTASWRTGQLAALLIVPIIVPFAGSYLVAPVFAPRYTLPASFGLYLLAGAGFMNLPSRHVRRVIVFLFLIGSTPLVGAYFIAEPVEDWRGAVEVIGDEAEQGDLLLMQPGWIDPYVTFYYRGPELVRVSVTREHLTETERAELTRRIERHDRVWVITYQGGLSRSLESVLPVTKGEMAYSDGVITVRRYTRPP